MGSGHYRYFIEVQGEDEGVKVRVQQVESRRAAARMFLAHLNHWLDESHLADHVSKLAVTLMGQIEIVCAPHMIERISAQDFAPIVRIRRGQHYSDNLRGLLRKVEHSGGNALDALL